MYKIYKLKFTLAFSETIEVLSGVDSTICKEEWRDEIVGNLFFPIETKPKGIILHLQGSGRFSKRLEKLTWETYSGTKSIWKNYFLV